MTTTDDPAWLRALVHEVRLFDRSSTAERVADVLRSRITEGELPPGSRLSEEQLVSVLSVSRNTLREAFRLLTHEGLLVHQMHRGVFVPELAADEVVDLYRLRCMIECDVVRSLEGNLDMARLRPLHDDVAAGESAAQRGDWVAVGTANMRFHQHLVELAGSRRMNEVRVSPDASANRPARPATTNRSSPVVSHRRSVMQANRNIALSSSIRKSSMWPSAELILRRRAS